MNNKTIKHVLLLIFILTTGIFTCGLSTSFARSVKPLSQPPHHTQPKGAIVPPTHGNTTPLSQPSGANYFPAGKNFHITTWKSYTTGYSKVEVDLLKRNKMIELLKLYTKQYKSLKNRSSGSYFAWERKVLNVTKSFVTMGDYEMKKRSYKAAYYLYLGALTFNSSISQHLPNIYKRHRNQINNYTRQLSNKVNNTYKLMRSNTYNYPYRYQHTPSLFDDMSKRFFVTMPVAGGKEWVGKGARRPVPTMVVAINLYAQHWSNTHYLLGASFGHGMFFDVMTVGTLDNYYEKRYDYSQYYLRVFPVGCNIDGFSVNFSFLEGRIFYFPDHKQKVYSYNLPGANSLINVNAGIMNVFVKPEFYTPNWRWNVVTGANIALTNYMVLEFIYSDENLPNYNGYLQKVRKFELTSHFSVIPLGYGNHEDFFKVKVGWAREIRYFQSHEIMDDLLTVGLSLYFIFTK